MPSRPRAAAEPGLAVQRAAERPAITLNSGVTWERLMFWADEDVEFIEATYEPGGASSPDDAFVRHSGHEFGYVLSGTLRVVVGFDEFILEARRLDHLPVVDAAPAQQRGTRDGAGDLGRPRPARRRAGARSLPRGAAGSASRRRVCSMLNTSDGRIRHRTFAVERRRRVEEPA